MEITYTGDPAYVLQVARTFIESDRARNNTMLVLLNQRLTTRDTGRYWVASEGGAVRGVVFQSPLDFYALVTPMPRPVITALVEKIVVDDVRLPGVGYEVQTASTFAGLWAELTKSVVIPSRVGRQYECFDVLRPRRKAEGELRLAEASERSSLGDWLSTFKSVRGGPNSDTNQEIDRAFSAGRIWVWYDNGPASMPIQSPVVDGAVTLQIVFTPQERRGRGYASASVAELTDRILSAGNRCMIYTNLSNPEANSIYRQLGYEVVQEPLQYEFQ